MATTLDFDSAELRDRVHGCWVGKNCGGTLGAPLEKAIGEPEPFDVWWYPLLKEGGIPNDDLEMQLVWLRAFEEHGPAVDARVLAEHWLNHIGYNWDEYGLARTNLRLGLPPPLSGSYNNWFADCMGCPIRSEIFACLAPGLPRLAVRYAYEDAIVDHAGGESVYGEMFNTAIESAAFLVQDLDELLDIGRSYVRDGSRTAMAIDAARQARRDGLDWKAAREKVLAAAPHYNSQYSPINMGFQTIGLLYGRDFGEALCITVNCGYDTDCTGATVGAILGIILGNRGLPEKWTAPLGDAIATNESWGGLRNCGAGPGLPRTLHDLTARTLAAARRVSGGLPRDRGALRADDKTRELQARSPRRVSVKLGTVRAQVDYPPAPVIRAGAPLTLKTVLENTAPVALDAACTLHVPAGWRAPAPCRAALPASGETELAWEVTAPDARAIENANLLYLRVEIPERVAQPAAPVPLIGARRMRLSGPYDCAGLTRAGALQKAFPPETGDNSLKADGRGGEWRLHEPDGNDLGLGDMVKPGQAVYVQAFFRSATAGRKLILGLPTTGAVRSWLNGVLTHDLAEVERFRPHGHKTQPYLDVVLHAGFNEILAKFVLPDDVGRLEAHLILVDPADLNAGVVDVGWTRLPWDDKAGKGRA